jgi:hypothetical protein
MGWADYRMYVRNRGELLPRDASRPDPEPFPRDRHRPSVSLAVLALLVGVFLAIPISVGMVLATDQCDSLNCEHAVVGSALVNAVGQLMLVGAAVLVTGTGRSGRRSGALWIVIALEFGLVIATSTIVTVVSGVSLL